MSLLISMQTLFTADLCAFITLFGTCRCKFTNYIRNMQVKKRKKLKGTKWNNPVSLSCTIFAAELKKSAHNDTTFKKKCLPLSRQLRQTGDIDESY